METTGKDGFIQVTDEIYEALSPNTDFKFEQRGNVYVKGKGILNTYYLNTVANDNALANAISSEVNMGESTSLSLRKQKSSYVPSEMSISPDSGDRIFTQGRKSSEASAPRRESNVAVGQLDSVSKDTSKSIHGTGSASLRSGADSLPSSANNSKSADMKRRRSMRKNSVLEMISMPEGDVSSLLSVFHSRSGSRSGSLKNRKGSSGGFKALGGEGVEEVSYEELSQQLTEGVLEELKDEMKGDIMEEFKDGD
jgi:hypothetical protein